MTLELRFSFDAPFSREMLAMVGGAIRNAKAYTVGRVVSRIGPGLRRQGECWVWNGYRRNGYGVLSLGGEPRYVHRLIALLYVGDLGDGLEACHRCDVKECARPDHIFIGTHQDNIADAKSKGRMRPPAPRFGPAHHSYRITEDIIAAVRAARDNEGLSQRELATRFGINQSTAWNIFRHKGRFI